MPKIGSNPSASTADTINRSTTCVHDGGKKFHRTLPTPISPEATQALHRIVVSLIDLGFGTSAVHHCHPPSDRGASLLQLVEEAYRDISSKRPARSMKK